MATTNIEWAEAVWNPTVGCTRVSDGCRNCYAERMAKRLAAMGRPEYQGLLTSADRWNGRVKLLYERLGQPLRWKKPRRIFVDSMSDLFHEDVPIDYIANVWAVMRMAEQHTYLVLTKRAERMCEVLNSAEFLREYHDGVRQLSEETFTAGFMPLDCVWLGVSVETQREADERIPWLLRTPAKVRFVSCEPLLGPIDFNSSIGDPLKRGPYNFNFLTGEYSPFPIVPPREPHIDWVIAGGESGPDARPMHPDWARSVRDQCAAAGVAFFFKQWGEWLPKQEPQPLSSMAARGQVPIEGNVSVWVGKKAAGNLLDGKKHEEYPNGR